MVLLLSALSMIALATVLSALGRSRNVLGTIIESDHPRRSWRLVGTALLLIAGAVVMIAEPTVMQPFAVAFLMALVVHQIRPGALDRVSGTEGVRAGWHSRTYDELEEWRLTGDHLRFRLFGQWTAVPLAVENQEPIRARLLEVAPDRESSFNQ